MTPLTSKSLLDLRKLRHALLLAETGSFVRAGAELHITQSALTRSIQSLEKDLDIVLFERSSSGVKPTRLGEEILSRANGLLSHAFGIRQDVDRYRKAQLGNVILGVGPMIAPLIAPLMAAVMAEAPGLSIRVEVEPAYRLLDLLMEEAVDFFISDVTTLGIEPGIRAIPLGIMPVGYFVRPGHPLATESGFSLFDAQQYPLISARFRTSAGYSVQDQGGDWQGLFSCESLEVLVDIALHTDGILLAARAAVEPQCRAVELVALYSEEQSEWKAQISLCRLAGRTSSPAITRVMDKLVGLLV